MQTQPVAAALRSQYKLSLASLRKGLAVCEKFSFSSAFLSAYGCRWQ